MSENDPTLIVNILITYTYYPRQSFLFLTALNFIYKCQILYYIREGYYNSATKLINKSSKGSNDAVLKYYASISMILQGRLN